MLPKRRTCVQHGRPPQSRSPVSALPPGLRPARTFHNCGLRITEVMPRFLQWSFPVAGHGQLRIFTPVDVCSKDGGRMLAKVSTRRNSSPKFSPSKSVATQLAASDRPTITDWRCQASESVAPSDSCPRAGEFCEHYRARQTWFTGQFNAGPDLFDAGCADPLAGRPPGSWFVCGRFTPKMTVPWG